MNVLKLSFLACFFAVFALGGYSQAEFHIVPPGVFYMSQDTISCDSTLIYIMRVVNVGNATYSGGIIVKALYNADTNVYSPAAFNAPAFHENDTMLLEIHEQVAFPYVGGDNIIIVWPASTEPSLVPTRDSTSFQLFATNCPVSIEKPIGIGDRFKHWPNPVKERLQFNYLDRKDLFESVRIYDLLGKEIYLMNQTLTEINTENFPSGLYLLKVSYKDGVEGTFRFVKE